MTARHPFRPALAGTLLLWLAATAPGCERRPDAPAARLAPATEPVAEEHGDDEGHGHAEAEEDEPSDLDRPVDELLAEGCEHGIPMYECAECRYEAGVARVPPADPAIGALVQNARIEPRSLGGSLVLTGEVAWAEDRVAHVGPRTAGALRAAPVDLGAEVAAGDLLAELDSREVAEAQAEYLLRKAELNLALRTLTRERSLSEQGITAGQDRYQAQVARDTAQLAVDSARERLLLLGQSAEALAALDENPATTPRGRLEVRAPLAGMVVDRHASLGELVEEGQTIFIVADPTVVWVWADLREPDQAVLLAAVERGGATVEVTTASFPGETFEGRVDYTGGAVDPESRTLPVRATVANPQRRLRAGMFVEVRLVAPPGPPVPAVPQDALLSDEGREFLFVRLDDRYFIRRPVTAGRSDENWVELLGGPPVGTEVATVGAFILKSDVLRSKMGAGCAD